jgi:hypothetical protein
MARRRPALMRTAKPSGPGARGWRQAGGDWFEPYRVSCDRQFAGDEARRIRLRGEFGISRQPTAQGTPECSDCTCMLVCVFHAHALHTRPRVQQAPGVPCASRFGGETNWQGPGGNAPRERGVIFGLLRALLSVVPANAGTHTPRRMLFCRDGRRLCFNNQKRWLWVPACAGTTGGKIEPTPPAPRSRRCWRG